MYTWYIYNLVKLMMSTHRERNTENGLFIKQRVKEKQPVCVVCCGKSYSVNKE